MRAARQMALGGMMAALAVVIMNLGSVIPVNTYICPVLCILLCRTVLDLCGKKIAWCFYMAVTALSLLLAPDREAALVYAFLGYYPMVRPWFDRLGFLAMAAKLVFFTVMGAVSYGALLLLMGAGAAMEEGWVMTAVTVILWDVLFLLVDRILGLRMRRR